MICLPRFSITSRWLLVEHEGKTSSRDDTYLDEKREQDGNECPEPTLESRNYGGRQTKLHDGEWKEIDRSFPIWRRRMDSLLW